jgi:hypothetical protein
MQEWIGKALGLQNVSDIESVDVSLAASWAEERAFWVYLAAAALVVLAMVFYTRYQTQGASTARTALGICRGLVLALLLITLADPVLRITLLNKQPPYLYVLFDGTDSMAIEDELPDDQRARLNEAVGTRGDEADSAAVQSRMEYVQRLIGRTDDNLLQRLQQEKQVQLAAFLFDGNTTSKLRKIELSPAGDQTIDPAHIAAQLSTRGQVTALGSAIADASNQFGASNLAGVLLFSDFAQNAGPSPLGDRTYAPAARLGAPIYAVGLGAVEAVDLAVDLQTDPKMKKAERSTVLVKVRQSGLEGRTVSVALTGRRLSGESSETSGDELAIGSKSLTLDSSVNTVEFPFMPDESGRFEFAARVEPLEGEIVDENNHTTREVHVIDDYLRLMYVANEPNWEWRFIKEVFHRDKLVGMDGFRTFLASSDPRVRESNVLFVPTLTPKRSDFFANDVIFLADMPRQALNDRFCEMVKEYVGNLGGGLVVIAGPEHGIKDLQGTAIADMLPVVIDPQAEIRTAPQIPEFRPRLTAHADRYSFMRLGASDTENAKAWDNLGKLPWYQPVAALHEQAFALAEYPAGPGEMLHVCKDGKTPQPLIAVRQYGKGEVVYLAMNEMWRLRRRYGEKYYREFWSQLIYRLGMSHALGNDKRFVARIDQPQYRSEDKVTLTVEAYDENYEPLTDDRLAGRTLQAELTVPGTTSSAGQTRNITVPLLRPGMFEARIPVIAAGEYALRVKDPVTSKFEELRFEVTSVSAERRRGVRDEQLQRQLALETQGKSYDLTTVTNLVNDLEVTPQTEIQTRNFALWGTPWWFAVVVALMLGEWLARKMIKLT